MKICVFLMLAFFSLPAQAAEPEAAKAPADFGMFRAPLPDPDGRVQGKWDYPALRPIVQGGMGQHIARTMRLLSESTPQKRNKVRILIYGQSLSKQSWAGRVRDELSRRFPHAQIEFHNRAIGGFIASMLRRTLEHDVIPLYPDLVILHDYGRDDDYEEIIRQIRTRTTAEIMIQTDPLTPGQNAQWHDEHAVWMNGLAARWGLELVDVRRAWSDYVADQKIALTDLLLKDKGHLNDRGNFVWAETTLQHLLAVPPANDTSPCGDVTDLAVGTTVKWKGNVLRTSFVGNRVDLVGVPSARGGAASVRVDGVAPSQWPQLYSITRPNSDPNRDWPWETGAITRVDHQTPLLIEHWSVVFTSVDPSGKVFGFDVAGSVTGPDGSGDTAHRFVSSSGRVVFSPGDWFLERVQGKRPNRIGPGYKVVFSVQAHFADTFIEPGCVEPSAPCVTTIVQGLPAGKHTLELTSISPARPNLTAIRIYRPMNDLPSP